MSAGRHAGRHHHLHLTADSRVHRLAPEAKLLGLVAFAVAVAALPRRMFWPTAVDAAVLATVVAVSRIPLRTAVTRLAAVVPLIAFAFMIPFVSHGDASAGWWATWNIVSKALLGAGASIVFSATTSIPDMLHGFTRLRIPRPLTSIVALMIRYLDLIVDQFGRMRTAMAARAYAPRWLWQVRPIASSAGVAFVRCYERGERVHQAMLARGYSGAMPELDSRRATPADWGVASVPALIALAMVVMARSS